MKKLFVIVLSLMLCIGLSACTKSNEKEDKETEKKTESKETEKKTESKEEQKKQITKSVIDGDTITNEALGFTMTLPEDWSFASKKELKLIFGQAAEIVDDADVTEAMEEGDIIPILVSSEFPLGEVENSNTNINAFTMKSPLSAKSVAKATEATVDSSKEMESTTEVINGNEFYTLATSSTDLQQKQYFIKKDGYIICITSTFYDEAGKATTEKSIQTIQIEE